MQRTNRRLRVITDFRATTGGGLNLAYVICVERTKEQDCAGPELGSPEIAYSGCEWRILRARVLESMLQEIPRFQFSPLERRAAYARPRKKPLGSGMKANRTINLAAALLEAKAGHLRGTELRRVIKIAEELGKGPIAEELKRCLLTQRVPRKARNRPPSDSE